MSAEGLVVKMAQENPTWGYTRIVGALKNLRYPIARSSLARILAEHGLTPAPERGERTRWSTFLKSHWQSLAAADFFTVEVLSFHGLIRYHVFFVIELATRRVQIAGIRHAPDDAWMMQVARNLLDASDGFLRDKRHLILDHDPLYSLLRVCPRPSPAPRASAAGPPPNHASLDAFRRLLRDAGTKPLLLPARSPNLNAYAERFVLSVKSECLRHFIPLSENHLRYILTEYSAHYHLERNHQGIGNALIHQRASPANDNAPVKRRQRLGGVLSFYERRAG